MADHSANPTTPPETPQSSKAPQVSIDQPSHSSTSSRELGDCFGNWDTIGEQRSFYDEQDCLHLSCGLASEKLRNRKADDVVIFDYSLDPDYLKPADQFPPAEGPSPPGHFSADDDMFSRVSKNELMKSKQFDQIIGPPQESQQYLLQGPRLGIMDFPQCYDTYDGDLLHSMGEKLGLQKEGETTFMSQYLERVRKLPGHERFRTGVSLRAPFIEPAELSRSKSRFILFASFPYFGGSSKEVVLDSESESVGLLDFERLGLDLPARRAPASGEERDDIGGILVHQARYMIFDNYTMATFRSKEDSARDQVPLHRFQERVGAFRSMICIITNRIGSELPTLGKLKASLYKLEEDINEMILEAKACERNQGVGIIQADRPHPGVLEQGMTSAGEIRRIEGEDEQKRQDNVRERKQRKVRGLFASLNSLSAALFAVISVAERQISVLQDLHSVFSTSYRTKTKDYEKGYPRRRNIFYKNVASIPILSENPEQIWPNTLDTIDEVVRERKSFIKKVKGLVENMDIRRKIFSAFLKSEQAKAAPSEKTAQETTCAVKSTEDAVRETTQAITSTEKAIEATTEAIARTQGVIQATQAELVQQGQTLSGFTLVTTAFLPLSFCTSYFGMQTVKGFGGKDPTISLLRFWLNTGPVLAGILLLTLIIILWKRQSATDLRAGLKNKLPWSSKQKISDPEKPSSKGHAPAQSHSQLAPTWLDSHK